MFFEDVADSEKIFIRPLFLNKIIFELFERIKEISIFAPNLKLY